jgi:GNAT superfamily N-acetyltransferase
VQENYRNRGIGRAFFQWLEETWSGKAVALSLQATPTNYSAVTFYKRLGFEASPNRHLMKLL